MVPVNLLFRERQLLKATCKVRFGTLFDEIPEMWFSRFANSTGRRIPDIAAGVSHRQLVIGKRADAIKSLRLTCDSAPADDDRASRLSLVEM